MDVLKKEYISGITLFDLRLSEGEITVYADCLNFVLEYCSEERVIAETDCESKEELSWHRDRLLELFKLMECKEYLPERYKHLE